MTSNTQINEAVIVKSPGGSARKEIPLAHLESPHALGGEGVPDLWHIAESMPKLSQILKVVPVLAGFADLTDLDPEMDGVTEKEVEAMFEEVRGFEPLVRDEGKGSKEIILTAWHLAHDLKKRSLRMAAALQPILDLYSRELHVNTVAVPVELIQKVLEVHTGQDVPQTEN